MRVNYVKTIILALSLGVSSLALAVVQEHNFSISGSGGETGSGSFTWDDAVVPDGTPLADNGEITIPPEVLSLSIEISGGAVIGGSASFTLATCYGAYLENTPDFAIDINFFCDNGTNTIEGVDYYTTLLNTLPGTAGSTLTMSSGSTTTPVVPPAAVPTMSAYGLVLTMLGLLVVASRRLRASAKRD